MARLDVKRRLNIARKRRVRNIVRGTAERPRLSVHVSNNAIHAQVINDLEHKTIIGMKSSNGTSNIDGASKFAKTFAEAAKKAKVSKVVLDRGEKKYHGRLKAFADQLREEGLEF